MASPEKLLNLKIHKFASKDAYENALNAGQIGRSDLALTPEEPLPTASTSGAGIVQLYNDINSNDTTKAATAKAVKTAYDKANHSHPYLPDTTTYAGSLAKGGAAESANKVNEAVTFNNSGSAAESGTTFDGSTAITISYNTIGAAPTGHASDDNTYGLGTAETYGHVKVISGDISDTADMEYFKDADGIAAGVDHRHDGLYAGSTHNQASDTINAMTGYSKASSVSAISTSDSLNAAIGKLEKALDGKQASGNYASNEHAHGNITNGGVLMGLGIAQGDKVVVTDSTGKISHSSITTTQLDRLSKILERSYNNRPNDTITTFNGTTEFVTSNTIPYVDVDHPIALLGIGSPDRGDALYKENNALFTYKPSTGTITAKAYNASSDRRLKENLVAYEPEKSILDLPIYSFNFKNNPDKTQIGCMAQDLQEICPELVTEGSDGYLSISESKLVYLLLLELKKMKSKLTEAGIM